MVINSCRHEARSHGLMTSFLLNYNKKCQHRKNEDCIFKYDNELKLYYDNCLTHQLSHSAPSSTYFERSPALSYTMILHKGSEQSVKYSQKWSLLLHNLETPTRAIIVLKKVSIKLIQKLFSMESIKIEYVFFPLRDRPTHDTKGSKMMAFSDYQTF